MIEIQFVILLCAIALFGLISAVVIGDICQAARLREELARVAPHWTPAVSMKSVTARGAQAR